MTTIYNPAGRAGEYARWAANLYRGCGHACIDCYAPSVLKMSREDFSMGRPRKDILAQLERAAKKWAEVYDPTPVLLSFTTDPYQPDELEYGITREALRILIAHEITPCILTKGGMRASRDFDLLAEAMPEVKPWFGQTLTFTGSERSRYWEPWSALPLERFTAASLAKKLGLLTWASLEPVRKPLDTLEIIGRTLQHGSIDHYKLGAWNYRREAQSIDWPAYYRAAVAMLKEAGFCRIHRPGVFEPGTYFIKQDLLERVGMESARGQRD